MTATKELYLLGVSFRTASVAVREALSFNPAEGAEFLKQAAAEMPEVEALILSTCNRTEFYLAAESSPCERWLDLLRRMRPAAPVLTTDCLRYQLSGAPAAQHLFRTASGLDSAILGDVQILGQVKEALSCATACGGVGPYLTRVFNHAIRAGRLARNSTQIGCGAASLGSALASMLAERIRKTHPQGGSRPRILLIGAGSVARDISRHLAKRRLGELAHINRTTVKARDLAEESGGRVLPWSSLPAALAEADIAIAATAATTPILLRDTLDEVVRHGRSHPRLVVDAGVPRNVEPGSLAEVIDIDAIREQQAEVLGRRGRSVPAVERIVEEELAAWERWRARLPLENEIKALYVEAAALSREAAPALAASEQVTLDEAEQRLYRSFKQRLHPHVRGLRGSSVKWKHAHPKRQDPPSTSART